MRFYIYSRGAENLLKLLEREKDAIHSEIGAELAWNPHPENRDKVIFLTKEANLRERDKWPEYIEWLTETTAAFRKAFQKRIKKIDFAALVVTEEGEQEVLGQMVRHTHSRSRGRYTKKAGSVLCVTLPASALAE